MNNDQIIIFHNPKCSKSRQALAILRDTGISPKIIEYLKTPPSSTELSRILLLLDMEPQNLVRKTEKYYKENISKLSLSRRGWIKVLVENPILIERPIVVRGEKAIVGRPPEKVLDLI